MSLTRKPIARNGLPEKEPKRTKDKVAIVGYAGTREFAPFDDPTYEIWGINDLYKVLPGKRWDRWWDLHCDELLERSYRAGTEHYDFLKNLQIPLYLLQEREDMPTSITYPLKEIVEFFSDPGTYWNACYFTSSPAYMLAYAIALGFKRIEVYGINLLGDDEYEYQRPCFEYWLGLARGMGIEIFLPEGCTLLKSAYRYGYDTHGQMDPTLSLHLRKRGELLKKQAEELSQKLLQVQGAMQANGYAAAMNDHVCRGGVLPDENSKTPGKERSPNAEELRGVQRGGRGGVRRGGPGLPLGEGSVYPDSQGAATVEGRSQAPGGEAGNETAPS